VAPVAVHTPNASCCYRKDKWVRGQYLGSISAMLKILSVGQKFMLPQKKGDDCHIGWHNWDLVKSGE